MTENSDTKQEELEEITPKNKMESQNDELAAPSTLVDVTEIPSDSLVCTVVIFNFKKFVIMVQLAVQHFIFRVMQHRFKTLSTFNHLMS